MNATSITARYGRSPPTAASSLTSKVDTSSLSQPHIRLCGGSREAIETKCDLAREVRGTFQADYTNFGAGRRRDRRSGRARHRAGQWSLCKRGPRYCAQGGGDRRHEACACHVRQAIWARAVRARIIFASRCRYEAVPKLTRAGTAAGGRYDAHSPAVAILRPTSGPGHPGPSNVLKSLSGQPSADASLVPAQQEEAPGKIDKSALTIGEPSGFQRRHTCDLSRRIRALYAGASLRTPSPALCTAEGSGHESKR